MCVDKYILKSMRRSCIWIDILKNTEGAVSGLIQTKVLLESIEFKSKLYLD